MIGAQTDKAAGFGPSVCRSLTGSGSARPHLAGKCGVRRLRSCHGEVDAMDDVAGAPR
jgi:hypothetical protein